MAKRANWPTYVLLVMLGITSAAAGAQSPLDALVTVDETSTADMLIAGADDVATYLRNPDTVCTGFLPTNQAMQKAFTQLGPYVGIVASNVSLTSALLNNHIIPGTALSSGQLQDGQQLKTRQGGIMTVSKKGDDIYVYSIPEEPSKVIKRDIPAGRCTAFLVDFPIAPASMKQLLYDLRARVSQPNKKNSSSSSSSAADPSQAGAAYWQGTDGKASGPKPAPAGGSSKPPAAAQKAPAPAQSSAGLASRSSGVCLAAAALASMWLWPMLL